MGGAKARRLWALRPGFVCQICRHDSWPNRTRSDSRRVRGRWGVTESRKEVVCNTNLLDFSKLSGANIKRTKRGISSECISHLISDPHASSILIEIELWNKNQTISWDVLSPMVAEFTSIRLYLDPSRAQSYQRRE